MRDDMVSLGIRWVGLGDTAWDLIGGRRGSWSIRPSRFAPECTSLLSGALRHLVLEGQITKITLSSLRPIPKWSLRPQIDMANLTNQAQFETNVRPEMMSNQSMRPTPKALASRQIGRAHV